MATEQVPNTAMIVQVCTKKSEKSPKTPSLFLVETWSYRTPNCDLSVPNHNQDARNTLFKFQLNLIETKQKCQKKSTNFCRKSALHLSSLQSGCCILSSYCLQARLSLSFSLSLSLSLYIDILSSLTEHLLVCNKIRFLVRANPSCLGS